MNNKKSKLFLRISLAFFALSVIAVIICIIVSYGRIKTDFPNDPDRVVEEFIWLLFCNMILVFPIFAVELSCIRSVYKILKHEPKGLVKICYLISAILSFSAFVLQCLIFTGLINFVLESGDTSIRDTLLLLTEWPVFIVSFALGSVHKKRDSNVIESPVDYSV